MRLVRYGAQRGPAQCRLCGAEVVWALTDHGRRMPIDRAPVDGALWVLWWYAEEEPEPLQRVTYFRESAALPETPLRWRPHWGTCSNRDVAHHLAERHDVERPERAPQLELFPGGRR